MLSRFRVVWSAVIGAVFAVLGGLMSAPASAAVPAAVGTTLTAVQTDALDVLDLVWPVALAIIGGLLLFKITKRVLNKV